MIEHNNHHSIIMQEDICYNAEKMHEPFPFTQDNQWDDSYFYKGENALPGSQIKSKPNQTETSPLHWRNRRLPMKLIWNRFIKKKCIFITIYNSHIYLWCIVFLPRVSKSLNYHDQSFNGELMRVVTGPFICVLRACLAIQIKAIPVIEVTEF